MSRTFPVTVLDLASGSRQSVTITDPGNRTHPDQPRIVWGDDGKAYTNNGQLGSPSPLLWVRAADFDREATTA